MSSNNSSALFLLSILSTPLTSSENAIFSATDINGNKARF